MFTISKIFWFFFNPENLILLLFLAGAILLFTRRKHLGRNLIALTAALILGFGIFPIGEHFIGKLENRFPSSKNLPPKVSGIIVLGGTLNQHITSARGQPSLTSGAERYTEFFVLAQQFPSAQLIFSGGSGSLLNPSLKEADGAKVFFNRLGLTNERILYESQSRNTVENATYSKRLAGVNFDGNWILITSAIHMPRAMGVFRNKGWNVVGFPVDYTTDGKNTFTLKLNPFKGLSSLSRATREWIGLFVYWLLGHTKEFFPKP
tara:strand:- start:2218 stop:3006 length:789 start_codon:yes stop_codon:yes gene_type:complete